MIHTREGAHAVNMMMSHAGAKQRKMVLKALKGNVARIVRDEHGSAAVMCMLDCVDDTTQLGKVIVNELKAEGLADLAEDGAARRVLLHLLRPRSRRYTHPHVLATIPDQDEVVKSVADAKASLTAQGHAVGGEDDEDAEEGAEEGAEGADADMEDEMDDDDIMDDEFDVEDEDEVEDTKENKKANGMTKFKSKAAEAAAAVDDSDDEDGAGGTNAGTSDSIDFGIAKKPNDARRTEIFGTQGKLGVALVNACEPDAAAMLRSVAGCDVLVETCAGGAGNVLTKAVGVERLGELHAAVAEAVRKSVAGEEDDEGADDETDGGKPREPLHTGFFSSRALRRMVLDIPGDEPHGSETAPSFANALWTGAIADHLEEWVGGHGAKVVAAVVKAGDAATVRAATAALTKVIEGKSVEEWTAGFFRARDGDAGAKKGGGVNGKSKKKTEPVAAPKTPAKTPAKTPGKKTGSKKETKEEAPPSSEGSMKKKKFSPRQTRGQRAAKAGK
jgi:pumilio family protein 6